MSKFFIKTFGCKLNQFDSERIREGLILNGYFETEDIEQADIIVINSCGVTRKAEKECFYFLRRAKRKNNRAKVYFIGCFTKPDDKTKATFLKGENKFLIQEIEKLPFFPQNQGKHARPLIYIQNGCDLKCSYCIVPKFRGKSRSVASEKVIDQIEHHLKSGKKEVVLTGIHLGLWGHDLTPAITILELLKEIEKKFKNKIKVRISSLDSNEISNELIDFFATSTTVQPHFHIPLQSGSDEILKLMRRRYNKKQFASVVENLKKKVKDCCIGADIIVGFPEETDDRFQETYTFVKSLPIDYLHVFPFSKREGTEAYSMKGQIEERVKKERVKLLRRLSDEKRRRFMENFKNRIRMGIVIHPDLVLTDNYIQVRVEQNLTPSTSVKVKITSIPSTTIAKGTPV